MVSGGQPRGGVPPGDLVAEHGADGAVHVAYADPGADRLGVLEGRAGEPDQLVVERPVEPVVLRLGPVEGLAGELLPHLGDVEDRGEVETRGLPVVDRGLDVEGLHLADGLLEGAEAELGEELAHLLGRCTRRR